MPHPFTDLTRLRRLLPFLALVCTPPLVDATAPVVGVATAIKGEVIAVAATGEARELRKGGDVLAGDRIKTMKGSYALIRFSDGAKATVRPRSELVVERYDFQTEDDGAVLELVKGGLRAVTGAMVKTKPEAFEVRTNVATLGVRGTDFEIRVCLEDCAAEGHYDRIQ